MSLKDKIDLENKIFARAAHLQVPVYSKYGGLISTAEDLELQTMLYVYNAQFQAKNYQQFCSPAEALQARQNYKVQQKSFGRARIYGKKDLKFELLLTEEK
ncbi:MAG: hypothetical protein J6Y17_03265 [Elusimicrobiaceae bacterium]|nr:hypothetical protein [Elusimicrobiaceae bacterium]